MLLLVAGCNFLDGETNALENIFNCQDFRVVLTCRFLLPQDCQIFLAVKFIPTLIPMNCKCHIARFSL